MPKRKYYLPLAGVLLYGFLKAGYADSTEDFYTWANQHYQKNTACTVASISSVTTKSTSVDVVLSVENSTAMALGKSPTADKNNWMALHCPFEGNPVWREHKNRIDVRISASLGSPVSYTLSCRQYENRLQQQRAEKRTGVLAKLKQLLNGPESTQEN